MGIKAGVALAHPAVAVGVVTRHSAGQLARRPARGLADQRAADQVVQVVAVVAEHICRARQGHYGHARAVVLADVGDVGVAACPAQGVDAVAAVDELARPRDQGVDQLRRDSRVSAPRQSDQPVEANPVDVLLVDKQIGEDCVRPARLGLGVESARQAAGEREDADLFRQLRVRVAFGGLPPVDGRWRQRIGRYACVEHCERR